MFRILNDCHYIDEKNEERIFKKIKGNRFKTAFLKDNKIHFTNSNLNIKRVTKNISYLNNGIFYLIECGEKFLSIQTINDDVHFPIRNGDSIEKKNLRDLKIGQNILMINNGNMSSTSEEKITNIFQFPVNKFKIKSESNKMSEYILLNSEGIINDFILL